MSDGEKNGRLSSTPVSPGSSPRSSACAARWPFSSRKSTPSRENDAIADRSEKDGYHDVAEGYRFTAKAHRECAERITREALEGFFGGLGTALDNAKNDGKE